MARPVRDPLTQKASTLLGGVSGVGRGVAALNRNPDLGGFLSTDQARMLDQGLGALSIGLGGLGIKNTIDDPYLTDTQKAIRTARSAVSMGNTGAKMSGLGSLGGYAAAIDAGFGVADAAANPNLRDSEKAYESLHQVGRAVADYYVPMGGMFADALKLAALDPIIYGDNHYLRTRLAEGSTLPRVADATFRLLGTATTPEDLSSLIGLRYGNAQARIGPEDRGGRLAFGGHHLDTGGLDDNLHSAYAQQAALIGAAQAGDPQAMSMLAALQQENAARDGAIAAFHRAQTPNPGGQGLDAFLTPQRRFDYYNDPALMADQTFSLLDDWMRGNRRLVADYGANSQQAASSAQEIARLQSAADVLGLDLAGAAERAAQFRQEEQDQQANASRSAGG